MPRKFRFTTQTVASLTVTVELSDEDLKHIATDVDIPVAQLTLDHVYDIVSDRTHEVRPWLCSHCSRQDQENVSVELGDEWEPIEDRRNPNAAICEITGTTDSE